MAEPLSKETFETYTREHQKYLDSKFDKLAGCVEGVKHAREKAWETHAQECSACRDCQDKKLKKLHKALLVGCVCAALLGAVLAPSLGWTHVIGFITKLLTGTPPIGM
jgi:hypothetical protein